MNKPNSILSDFFKNKQKWGRDVLIMFNKISLNNITSLFIILKQHENKN